MQKIDGWEAKRAGPAITLTGKTDGKPVKIIGVRLIARDQGQTIAHGKDGTRYLLD